jgi:hypothetical protein
VVTVAALRPPLPEDEVEESDAATPALPHPVAAPASATAAVSSDAASTVPVAEKPSAVPMVRVPRDLRADFETDVEVRRLKEAVADLALLLDQDPKAAQDRNVRRDVVELSQRIMQATGREPEELFALITQRMGPTGIDILFELFTEKGGSRAAKQAEDLLSNPNVRARGSPALRIAYDVRMARSCQEKIALFPRAKQDGDYRTLGQLQALNHACGRRSSGECCLHNDARLRDAIDSLKAR